MESIKREITDYWTGRVEKFEALRLDELNSNKRGRWLYELHRYLPTGRKLDILDIGTGTVFFSFLLAAEGYNMTGIDLTEEKFRSISSNKHGDPDMLSPVLFSTVETSKTLDPARLFDHLRYISRTVSKGS